MEETIKHSDFFELYKPVHEQLCRYCRIISGNLQDAEDLVNDTIIAAYKNKDKIKQDDAFKSYIFSIAGNINKMRFRRKKFKAEFNEKEYIQISGTELQPDRKADFNLIFEKLMLLPEKYRDSLILFYISDLHLNEIQKIQNCSLSAVKQRLKRGREKLLNMLNTPQQIKTAMLLLTI